jgi:short subunit dehydrogenase-like uncharacterized protein
MGAGRRDLDIVLYGATGFMGRLVADYLAKSPAGLQIGLAGRSSARLAAVRRSLGAAAERWPVIVAEVTDRPALQEMAARARVVISTVGPYGRCGLPIVEACATAGTDYTDLAGEIPFVRASIERYHRLAADNGARIVHSCGFDSIPSDLNVFALHRRTVADAAGELGDTTFVLRTYSGGCSAGSLQTMLDLMRTGAENPALRAVLDDPYSLSPDRGAEPELGPQPDVEVRAGSEIAPELTGLWTGGYLMALYNTRCVRRSNALLNWGYGRRLRYTETLSMGSTVAAPMFATLSGLTITGAARLGGTYLRLLPPGLLETMLPAGAGFDQGDRGYYKVETYTTTTRGQRYVATMSQQGDPGYSATATLIGVSALTLARGRDRLATQHGVLTPAAAMGDALLELLPTAGVALHTARLG